MPKTVPIALSTHKAQPVITTSRLLRIDLSNGTTLRMTSLDRNEEYDDDGNGEETWYANTGLQMSTMEATNDLSVDNSEARSLVPIYPLPGITEDMVNKGELNDATYWVYEHDYEGGAAGVHEIMASGPLGACRMEHGLVAIPELRSWTQLFDQTGIISQTCLDCRTKRFGSQDGDEREFCGFDISGEWETFTVTAVGTESVREFYTSLAFEDDRFAPGLVTWTGGDNTGSSVEVESFFGNNTNSDAYVSLRFTVRKPVQVGDTGQIRRDCTRKWTGHNSCETFFGTSKGAHFNGEPYIYVGDSKANTIPGVNTTTNTGGSGEPTPTVPADTDGVSTTTRTRGATVVTVSSALGNGSTDVTASIQTAIDSLPSDGGTVTIPPGATGAYRINMVTGLLLRSNMLLEIQPGAELHGIYTSRDHVGIVKIHGVHDVEVSGGGVLRGFRDEWAPIAGTTSEWGHCIECFGSRAVTVSNITAMKAVGDGMSVGHFGSLGCSDIFVDGVRFHDNRRQGLSLVYVDGCVVQDSEFDHISGTAPESGIDIEPNGGVCKNITITNCHIHDNKKYGINILQLDNHGTVESITVQDCTVESMGAVGIVSNGVKNVQIKSNTIRLNSAQGLSIIDTTNIDVTDNTFTSNTQRNTTWANTSRTPEDITGTSSKTTHDILMEGLSTGVFIGTNHYT